MSGYAWSADGPTSANATSERATRFRACHIAHRPRHRSPPRSQRGRSPRAGLPARVRPGAKPTSRGRPLSSWTFGPCLVQRSGPSAASFAALAQRDVEGAFRQLLPEAALIEFGHQRAFELVALVEEGEAKGEADVPEDLGVLDPGDDGARAHDR